jgi:hypothetical protein
VRLPIFVAGPVFGIGIGTVMAVGLGAMSLTILGAALGFLAVSVIAGYASSRIWQGTNFDNLEINAQRTADHLVEKLKENNLCLTEEKNVPCRSDGKSWVQVTQAAEAEHLRG